MRSSVRNGIVAASGLAVLSTVAIVAASAGAESSGQAIDWQPCPEQSDVDCGTVTVPIDWGEPEGDTTDIRVFRWAATDPQERVGSVLTLGVPPDSPPGSGIATVTARLNEKFDVVSFSPRDSGIECDEELVRAALDSWNPRSAAEFGEMVEANRQLSQDCRERTGPLYDNVDNRDDVHDMDAIRGALGEDELNYVSGSEGSLRGQQYAEEYPRDTGAIALDANQDHSMESTLEHMNDLTAAAEENFGAFADWCDEDTECALNGMDTKAIYGQLKERAKAGDLTDPETGEAIDFFTLSDLASQSYDPQQWADLATSLGALQAGDGAIAENMSPDSRMSVAAEENFYMQAQRCQNWNFPVSDYEEWREIESTVAERNPTVEWTRVQANMVGMCVGYDGETTNPQAPLDVDDAPPLLILGSRNDHTTPLSWSLSVAEQAQTAAVTYEGFGHMIYGGDSECVNDAVDAYFLDGSVPEDDVSCPGRE